MVWPLPGARVYIAGPMTGYEDFNRPAFAEAAARLRSLGHVVVSPGELDEAGHTPGDWPWKAYMRRDIVELMGCDTIALLPGWAQSKGARLETTLGLILEFKFLSASDGLPLTARSVSQELDHELEADQ